MGKTPSPDLAPIFHLSALLKIDLAGAILEERLTPAKLSELVVVCAQCWHLRKCNAWRNRARAVSPSRPPDFCPVGEDMARLKGVTSTPADNPPPLRIVRQKDPLENRTEKRVSERQS